MAATPLIGRICNWRIYLSIYLVYLYSAFHDANRCKAALQKIKVSTLYLVIAQVDVHMAEMYGKNQAVS